MKYEIIISKVSRYDGTRYLSCTVIGKGIRIVAKCENNEITYCSIAGNAISYKYLKEVESKIWEEINEAQKSDFNEIEREIMAKINEAQKGYFK